jgi:hypothetical protein
MTRKKKILVNKYIFREREIINVLSGGYSCVLIGKVVKGESDKTQDGIWI